MMLINLFFVISQTARKGTAFFSNMQIIFYNSRYFLFSMQIFVYLRKLLYLCAQICSDGI